MKRNISSLAFVFILMLPFIIWVTSEYRSKADEKNRSIPPGFEIRALMEPDYYMAWDNYFNEIAAAGGRLVFAKNWIDYNLFKTTDTPGIYVGKEGWLYDKASIEDVRSNACQKKGWVARLHRDLHVVNLLFEKMGRRFIFAVAPNKAVIYPEFLGSIPKDEDCGKSLYELWLDRQKVMPLPGFLRLDDSLRESRDDGKQVYDSGGTYWNSEGARTVAQAILDFIFPDSKGAPLENGNLARQILGTGTNDQGQIKIKENEEPIEKLASLLIYGGAHTGLLLPYLTNRFERVDAITSNSLPSSGFTEILDAYDIILLIPAESKLEHLCVEMDRLMNIFSADSVADDQHEVPLSKVYAQHKISLSPVENGIGIKSMGLESLMKIDGLRGSEANEIRILKLIFEAPVADTLRIRFDAGHGQTLSRKIKTGTNQVYIPLPWKKRLSLQINPGQSTGLFKLTSISILEIHSKGKEMEVQEMGKTDLFPYESQHEFSIKEEVKTKVDSESEVVSLIDVEPSINLNDFEEGQIFQRRGNSTDIIVSGSYTGSPAEIEAAVFRKGIDEPFIPWTQIDTKPSNNIFLGVLPEVPQGGWYRIAVRFSDQKQVKQFGSAYWGVGILVACIGQSNMRELFCTGMDIKPHSLLRRHYKGKWLKIGPEGNGAISLGNGIIRREGIPVGLLDYAVNGSGLCKKADYGAGYWADQRDGSIYQRFVQGVASAGGSLEYVIWMQGEADAGRVTMTQREYEENLVRFIEKQVRSDIQNGSSRPKLPFLIIGLPKRNGGDTKTYRAVRNAQIKVTETITESYMAASTLDLPHLGRQHLTPDAYTTLGLRVAQAILGISGKKNE